MKRSYFLSFAAMLFLAFFAAAFHEDAVSAQTARERQASPSPTPAPAASATPPLIAEEDEVVKVETELVNLNVRVVDRNNRPVNNVTEREFKIYEDGVLQQVGFFSKSEVPTNYSLVIDNSGSLRSQIEQVIEASKMLVSANKPEDEASVIRFVSSDKIEILQDFTASKTDLNDALDNLYIEGGQTAIVDAVYLAADRVSQYEKTTDNSDRKRRAMILVSDGEDVASFYTQQQLFDLLRETDVQIYAIGFVKDLDKSGGFISKSKQSKAKSFLEKLATETGGKAYFPDSISELNGIAKEIATELRTQYSIGYIPTNDRNDGTFRNIKVVVDDGPGNQKRIALTRAGRTADNEGAAAPALKGSAPAKSN